MSERVWTEDDFPGTEDDLYCRCGAYLGRWDQNRPRLEDVNHRPLKGGWQCPEETVHALLDAADAGLIDIGDPNG